MSFLPKLMCPSCILSSGARGSPTMGLHGGISVPLLLYASCSSGLAIPTLVQPSTHRVGRRGSKTHAVLRLGTVQLWAPVQESKGVFCFKMGCPGYRGLWPKSIPVPCIPGLCLGSRGAPRSSSCSSELGTPRFPLAGATSSQIT